MRECNLEGGSEGSEGGREGRMIRNLGRSARPVSG